MLALIAASVLGSTAASATLTFDHSPLQEDFQSLIQFEKISYYRMAFAGDALTGKSFELRVKRFDKGKLTLNWLQMDSSELGALGQVKDGKLSMKLMAKATDGSAKIDFQFPRFTSGKSFDAPKSKHEYVMKDFLGAETKMTFEPMKETYFLAYLLPTEHSDGFASYCEVAQSGVNPEELGDKFKVPTYFLLSIKFK